MTLDGNHIDVMRSKTWACWIFFVGFVLSLGVARECFSFEDHITNKLLKDHLFQIKVFLHPDETDKEGYTLLSIVDMMCTSLKIYGDLYDTPFNEKNYLELVKWSYQDIVNKSLNLTEKDNILTACEKHICKFSFNTSYISPNQLEEKYNSVCSWNGSLPACPSQNTSPLPLHVSHTTSTTLPTHPLTSTPSDTTSHQSTSTTSSSSQPRNMTPPSAYNKTPPACQPTSSNNPTDNALNPEKHAGVKWVKSKDENLLLSLLTVSCTVNVALFIVVWLQCRNRHQKNLPNNPEDNHHTLEFTCLRNRDQSEDNGVSISPAT